MSDHYQIQNVPKRNSNYCKSSISEGSGSLGRSIGIPSASSVASDISVLSLGSETLKNEVSGQKEGKSGQKWTKRGKSGHFLREEVLEYLGLLQFCRIILLFCSLSNNNLLTLFFNKL